MKPQALQRRTCAKLWEIRTKASRLSFSAFLVASLLLLSAATLLVLVRTSCCLPQGSMVQESKKKSKRQPLNLPKTVVIHVSCSYFVFLILLSLSCSSRRAAVTAVCAWTLRFWLGCVERIWREHNETELNHNPYISYDHIIRSHKDSTSNTHLPEALPYGPAQGIRTSFRVWRFEVHLAEKRRCFW